MTAAEALRQLQEIPPPAPVAYVPQTGGWLALLGALLLALTVWAWRAGRRYRADRYRRDAGAELAALQARLADPARRERALAALPALVKRTALGFAPRAQIAALSGRAWLQFLDRTLPATDAAAGFEHGPGQLLWRCAYLDAAALRDVAQPDIEALCALLRRWIDRHVPV